MGVEWHWFQPAPIHGAAWESRGYLNICKHHYLSKTLSKLNLPNVPFCRCSSRQRANLENCTPIACTETPCDGHGSTSMPQQCCFFRAFYKTLNPDLIWVFIFLDASLQERGRELFAASFDLVCRSAPEFCQRRYFAGVRIGHDLLSALGKTIALLWQIFLQIGPDFNLMRQFCSSVAGICSDLGTERLIARGADILIDFFNFIGAPVPGSTSRPSSKRVATPKSVLLYVLFFWLYFAHYIYE